MTSDVASRISEQHAGKPGWWVVAARTEAAARDGRIARKTGKPKPYSQMDLAMAIDRDRNTVWRWENEGIDYFSWMGLVAVLGLPVDWEPTAKPIEAATVDAPVSISPSKRKSSIQKRRSH